MRRGVGVGHVQRRGEAQRRMADLGARLTAERVGRIADELDALETQLRRLAAHHRAEIERDPVVRARFRQLADSLGVDLISSRRNVFAGLLGLGDFYYGLAGKVVEACMRERKFCGAYVPLRRIVQIVKRQYDGDGEGRSKKSVITEGDVCMALDKLHVLGDGYNVVELAGIKYIQTTPDGSRSADDVPLLNCVLEEQAKRIKAYRSTRDKNEVKPKPVVFPTLNMHRVGLSRIQGGGVTTERDVDNGENDYEEETGISNNSDIPLKAQCVALTQKELEERLMWQPHRVQAVLERMMQNGSVWVDYPEASGGALLSATEEVAPKKVVKRSTEVSEVEAVYWFIALVFQDEGTV
ncbi:ESCRT-II complex subunit VPS22 [Trypanosoma theileri]|uniref:ESCRT-II complex subunit VPS22 n=1 Tax=Trypanosoma theileri TaxID=67003 RepID=A0A1X0P9K2_9TRYP|nr:ESCRT-II complex subunit VPS22 [Trypanosoma theileri]ORC93558.1 ESCRT-II complex subunit VPS22 [Trypanosoma theileri]